ncbi:hypothetical protein Tco_0375791, partial [Tanacetum coccineum]
CGCQMCQKILERIDQKILYLVTWPKLLCQNWHRRPEKEKGILGCRVLRMAPNVEEGGPSQGLYLCRIVLKHLCVRTELITLDLACPSTHQLLQNSSGDSGPDSSFDKSVSLERLFSLARVSLAEGFVRGSFPSSFQWHAPIGAPESLFWNLHGKVSKEFIFSYPANQALFIRLFRILRTLRLFSFLFVTSALLWGLPDLVLVMLFDQHSRRFDVLLDEARKGFIGMPGPTDGANVEAYLSGPLGLGKRASNIRIIWFSFSSFRGGSFGGVSFGSSAESKSVYYVLTDHLIRRIHQLDTTYQTFYPEQRIEFYSLNRHIKPDTPYPPVRCRCGSLQKKSHSKNNKSETDKSLLHLVKMDDPNIIMEEYIRLEEEKAQRHGRTFNWQTAMFGKVESYEDEDDCFINFETQFPAIVFDNTLRPDSAPLIDLKKDSKNDEIIKPSSPELMVDCLDDLDYFKDFENEFPAIVYNDGLTSKSDLEIKLLVSYEHINKFETSLSKYDEEERKTLHLTFSDNLKMIKDGNDNNDITQPSGYMAPLLAADQRHLWLRYQVEGYTKGIVHSYEQRLETIWSKPVNRVHVLDFEGLTPGMRQDLVVRLRMVYTREGQQVFVSHAWRRLFWIRAPLVREFILEFLSTCRMSDTEMGLDVADMLGLASSDVLIRDPVRRLCHMMIAYSICGRDRHLRRHAEGRKSGAKLSGGHFIGRLAMHFGLVSDKGLRGLQAWVAQGPERQHVAATGAHEADEARPAAEESAQEIPAPAQAPPPPPPAPQPQTMSQRIERIKEEMSDLRHDVIGLRGVVESFITEQSRVFTWLISCMTQLMDASGHPYQAFDGTLSGSSRIPTRGASNPGQEMPALLQPLMPMTSPTLDLFPL